MPATLDSFSRMVEYLDTAVAILDLDGRPLHINLAGVRLLGRSVESFQSESLGAALGTRTDDQLAWPADVADLDDRTLGVFPVLQPDGELRPVEIRTRVVSATDGQPTFVLASLHHLSARLEQLNAAALTMLEEPGDDLLTTIVRAARALLGARYAALGVWEDDQVVRFIADGMSGADVAGIDHLPTGKGLLGAVMADRRTIRLASITSDPRHVGFPAGHPPMSSFLGTAIRSGDVIYGNLYFTEKIGAPAFNLLDERLAKLFASHAAVAIRTDRQRSALQTSERNLAEAQRIASLGSWEWDLATGTVYRSDETCRIYGIEPGRFSGRAETFFSLVHPDDRAIVLEAEQQTREGGAAYEIEFRIVRPDGTIRTIHGSGALIRDEDGGPGRLLGTVQDITEQVAAREALAASERRYAAIFDGAIEAILVAELGTRRFRWVNPAACALLGYTRAELLEMTVHEIHPPADLPRIIEQFEALATGSTTVARSIPCLRKDGVTRLVDVKGSMVVMDGVAYNVGFFTDVTEQVAAEEARTRLGVAIEQVGESVLILDSTGRITYVNTAFEQITGFDRSELLGGLPYSMREGEPLNPVIDEMWRELRDGRPWSGHMTPRRRDGTAYDLEVLASPVLGDDGQVMSYVLAGRDVSRERELESQLRQVQKMEAVGQLAGGIAHDFNNLLTAIRGYSELARDPAASEDQRRADLDEVVATADRAAALTRQLLAFGRRTVLRVEVVDPVAVVGGVVPLLRRLIGEHVRIETAMTPFIGQVRVDPGQFEQVIINLAVNARDAMPAGGTLTIAVTPVRLDAAAVTTLPEVTPGAYVELAVADTGTGMDAATRARIFEPFFTTKPTGAGTGLGLATVHGIIHQSGGVITVESVVGRGTTFRVLLPMVEPEPPVAAPSGSTHRAASGSETVLVVEDEGVLRAVSSRVLAENGYTVLEAADGQEALRVALAYPQSIDLLLTDIVMPGLAGPDVAQKVSSLRPEIRVLFISGYVDSQADRGTFEGVGPILAKPFTSEALLRAVRDALDDQGRARAGGAAPQDGWRPRQDSNLRPSA